MAKKKKVKSSIESPDDIAQKVVEELDAIQKKYNCSIGVWLSWRDLLKNLDILKENKDLEVLTFGLQLKLNSDGSKDKN